MLLTKMVADTIDYGRYPRLSVFFESKSGEKYKQGVHPYPGVTELTVDVIADMLEMLAGKIREDAGGK